REPLRVPAAARRTPDLRCRGGASHASPSRPVLRWIARLAARPVQARCRMDCDAIVIGSGMGGLTAALALARAGGGVLGLGQHFLPGGWAHRFPLGGYPFSPGGHYVGEPGPGANLRRFFEGLGLGPRLSFRELAPDGYDHI